MLQSWRSGCWKLGLAGSLTIGVALVAISGDCAKAQSSIVPDSTLGAESSVVPPQAPGSTVDVIEGGTQRGANLFHSFEQFSVLPGRTAYFNNALDIQNIISRVTGGSISEIDGLLQANGTANLFLLNPNGITFGRNASLNIGGSFLASTASSLKFADGTGFSATEPQTTPLLTVSVPIGLQFGGGEGSIVNRSVVAVVNDRGTSIPVGLQVQPGKTLALVGGDVTLEGGKLTAAAGRIELGSVAAPSLVSLTPTARGWTLGYESVQNFRNIELSQNQLFQEAIVDATGAGGGEIQVQGKRVTLTGGSQITSFTTGSQPGGTLTVNASESVELSGTRLDGQLGSSLRTDTTRSGDAGTLRITTGKLIVRDGARVSAFTSGTGQGGTLEVNAFDSVELSGTAPNTNNRFSSGLFAGTTGAGNAGDLKITTGQLLVQDLAEVAADARSGSRNAGNIDITARSIVLNQGRLTAESRLLGKEGQITLRVQDLLLLRRESLISTTAGFGEPTGGEGGNITIDAPLIVAVPSENSDIRANAFAGPGGNIQIAAQGIFGTQFVEQLTPESDINASGEVRLYTPDVEPRNGLVTLPEELVEVTGLIVQGCSEGGGSAASRFVVTGRGGLPPTPREALGSEPALVDLGTPVQGQENGASSAAIPINPTSSEPIPLVEAQGWVIGSNGKVVLTAQAPTITPHSSWLTPTKCHGS